MAYKGQMKTLTLNGNTYDVGGGSGGQPTPVSTAAAMVDHDVIYLYTGSESGYTAGHLYYWDGSTWVDGGSYGGGGGSVTVDSTMSSTSENPVQNKVIYSALQEKANASDIPTVVSVVTAGGTNPVNSVAVIAYINSLDATNTAY